MGIKARNTRHIILASIMLLTTVYLSGCNAATPVQAAAPAGPTDSTQAPETALPEKDIPQSSEGPQVPPAEKIPESVPVPEKPPISTPSTPADESDNHPAPTPAPDLPQTPIHPYYDLNGNPPTAPGLAMRVRVFDVEPQKIAYLTFDDGPYPETTPHILKILQDEGVKATFFVLGKQIEKYPYLLKAEYEQGEGIGNHTYSHDYSLIYPRPQAFLAEINRTDALIFRTIGIHPRILRAPGGTQGHFNVNFYNTLDAADYLIYDWNVSSGDADAHLVPADQLIHNIETQVPGKSRIIVLMHDAGAKLTTPEALPQIIQYLKQQGYSFGVITPKVAPILFPGGFRS